MGSLPQVGWKRIAGFPWTAFRKIYRTRTMLIFGRQRYDHMMNFFPFVPSRRFSQPSRVALGRGILASVFLPPHLSRIFPFSLFPSLAKTPNRFSKTYLAYHEHTCMGRTGKRESADRGQPFGRERHPHWIGLYLGFFFFREQEMQTGIFASDILVCRLLMFVQ